MAARPPIAIVQDHLVQRGGAERVLASLARAFPDAPIHVAFLLEEAVEPALLALGPRPFPLGARPAVARRHRFALPVLPLAFSALRPGADVTLCASSGWAAGCRPRGRKVVYHHALARWIHEPEAYGGGAAERAARALRPVLRRWDHAAVTSADAHLVPTRAMAAALAAAHGVGAEVLPPPSTLDPAGPEAPPPVVHGPPLPDGAFWLCPSRLLPYKRVDLVLAAARLAGVALVVAGGGPAAAALHEQAPWATFTGPVGDAELRWLYGRADGVVTGAPEPFGLVPIEAATFGRVTVAPAEGGALDTVVDGATGVLVDPAAPQPAALAAAFAAGAELAAQTDPTALREHGRAFGEAAFVDRLRAVVDEVARR